MKRYLSLALIMLMLPALLAVPARAAETEFPNYWVDLLDFGYAIGYSSNYIPLTGRSTPISYANPGGGELEYCEILLKTDSTTFRVGTWNTILSTASLGNGVYLAYGNLASGTNNASIGEFFFRDYDGSFVEILSFKVNKFPASRYSKSLTGRFNLVGTGSHDFGWPADSSTGLSNLVRIDNERNPSVSFTTSMEIPDWGTMDFIQVGFSVVATTIDTINVQLAAVSVPYSINFVDTNTRAEVTTSYIYLLIDVRELMLSTAPLVVSINGTVGPDQYGSFQVSHVLGLVEVPEPSPFTYWFTQVGNWFTQQTSALVSPIVTWGQNIVNSVSTWGQNLLDGINALPDKIAEALQAVFVPSDSAVQNMGQQSEELAQDRFGGAYEGALIIDEFASNLKPQQATQILTVPVVNLDILGVPFPLGGWEVDLVPDGTEIVVETCKIIIDIIATLAFINGLRNRLERTLER